MSSARLSGKLSNLRVVLWDPELALGVKSKRSLRDPQLAISVRSEGGYM